MREATAKAFPNIAFIKYWGNHDDTLRLPANPSLSMNLDGIFTQTTVRWDSELASDVLQINGAATTGPALDRVTTHLDLIRRRTELTLYAAVESHNNFPMGAGIASSASAFAALTVAAVAAAGADLPERELTILARQGSGSASRSVPGGFVEWHAGDTSDESYAESIAPPEHWDLVDVIAIVSGQHKAVGSSMGHRSAWTSELQPARVAGAEERLLTCKTALLARDFPTFAEVVERDSNLMHAIMMTSKPALFYWLPATMAVMAAVRAWRAAGMSVCYTLDAGPNVHCICRAADAENVENKLKAIPGVEDIRMARAGGSASVIPA